MRTRSRRLGPAIAGLAAIASLATAPASVDEGTAEPVPRGETMIISAGCPQDTPGTCTSTRWLGKTAGDSTTNFITSITPVDQVDYHLNGPHWRDYSSDDSWQEGGYLLRADEDLSATVSLTAQGPAAMMTVHARFTGSVDGTFVSFGEQSQTIDAFLPDSTQEVTFDFDIPDDLDMKALTQGTFEIAVHGVNVAAGYIDQEGGSTFEIPYWELREGTS